MASETSQVKGALAPLSTADLVARLSRFDGPPEQFLINLLALQCNVASAEAGAVLRIRPDGNREVLAVFPPLAQGDMAPVWLAQAAEQAPKAAGETRSLVKALHAAEDLYGQQASRHLILVPLPHRGELRGLAAFAIRSADPKALAESRQRLELTVALISLYEMRLTLRQRDLNLQRLRMAMETLAAVNQNRKFNGAAMAFCNEITARWQCERASLGFLRGRYVHLRAMSHTEKFSRKMKIVQDIEAAAEECLDQDLEVVYPAAENATYVSRAAGELSKRHGPVAIVSLPVRRAGEPVAVVTAERNSDSPFSAADVESLRLATELCTAQLTSLSESDRWFGARLAAGTRKGLSYVLGPRATWAKLTAVLVLAALLFLVFGRGEYSVEAPFTLDAGVQRIVPAPFDGFLDKVLVEPGDVVQGGQRDTPLAVHALTIRSGAAGAAPVARYDFGPTGSPVAAGHTRVTESGLYTAATGFGWAFRPEGSRQGTRGSAAERDSIFASSQLVFLADVPKGPCTVTVRLGGGQGALGSVPIHLEGKLVDTVSAGAGETVQREYTVDVQDGQMTLAIGKVTVLATLDTSELRLRLGAARVERDGHLREAASALQEGKTVEAQIARLQAERVAREIELTQDRIHRSAVVSPIDGTVLEGDIKKLEGKRVSLGDVLFRVAPLSELRADLQVSEDQVDDAVQALREARKAGRTLEGELSTVSHPDARIPFVVERINPVAEVVDNENVFKVRVRLLQQEAGMRPGLKGMARIPIGQRRYVWIWTRKIVNWLRMELWL